MCVLMYDPLFFEEIYSQDFRLNWEVIDWWWEWFHAISAGLWPSLESETVTDRGKMLRIKSFTNLSLIIDTLVSLIRR